MDKIDRMILSIMQRDGAVSVEGIGEKVGLSKAPCSRRIKRLRDSGVINKVVALLDPVMLNVGTTVFVMIKTSIHASDWLEKFSKAVQHMPEVTEIYRLSGDVDYMIRIMVPDIAGYDAVYKKMISAVEMSDVSASFVLETIKATTSLPLEYIRV